MFRQHWIGLLSAVLAESGRGAELCGWCASDALTHVRRADQPSKAQGNQAPCTTRVHTSLGGRGLELCGLLALPSRRSGPLILGSVLVAVAVYSGFMVGAIFYLLLL